MQAVRTTRGVTVRMTLAEARAVQEVLSGGSFDPRPIDELSDKLASAIKR